MMHRIQLRCTTPLTTPINTGNVRRFPSSYTHSIPLAIHHPTPPSSLQPNKQISPVLHTASLSPSTSPPRIHTSPTHPLHPLRPQPPTPPPALNLINKIRLRQRQPHRGLTGTNAPISLDDIALGIDLHLRHRVVVFHILLSDVAAVLDGFDAFAQAVGADGAAGDGGAGYEGDAGGGDEGLWRGRGG